MGTKNLGTRIGLTFADLGGVGLSAVGGPQDPMNEGLQRIAVDLDGSLTPTEDLLIGLEANVNFIEQAYVDAASDVTSDYVTPFGFLVMGNYTFTEWFNLTVRYDMLVDAPTGAVGEVPGAPIFGPDGDGDALTRSSVTVGPNFHLADGWDVFTEVRYDMASGDTFMVDGESTNGFVSGAVELIYQFAL
jgi:hypothetical protein